MELFYVGTAGGPCGVIVQRRSTNALHCTVSFRDPGGEAFESRCAIETPGPVAQWTSFSFVSEGNGSATVRRSDVPTGDDQDQDLVPGYGFSSYLIECWTHGTRSRDFGWLDESAGSELAVRPARFEAVGVEDMKVPLQFEPLLGLERVELCVGGERTNTYWIQQDRIVVSDWNGARSYTLDDEVSRMIGNGLHPGGITTPYRQN